MPSFFCSIYIVLGFLCFSSSIFAQKLDSITLQRLQQQAEVYDSAGYQAVARLGGYYYMQRNPEKLRYYTNKELEHATHNQDRKQVISALYHAVLYHRYYSNTDSVFQTAQQLIAYTRGDTSVFANRNHIRALLQIASSFYSRENIIDSAYVYYRQALDLAQQTNNKSQYAEVSQDIITIYRVQEHYRKVVALVDSTLAYLDPIGTDEAIERAVKYIKLERAAALVNMPDTTVDKSKLYQDYLDVLHYELDRGSLISPINITAKILNHFSDFLPLDSLLVLGEQAMELAEKSKNFETGLHFQHGKNLLRAGRLTEAENTLKQRIELMQDKVQRYAKLANTYDVLTRVYIKKGQIDAAEEMFNLYKTYQDSAVVDEYETEIEMIAANYELEKKQTENEFLQERTDKLEVRTFYLSIIGLLLVAILLAGYIVLQKIRSQNKRLKQLVETKNKIFSILAHDLKTPVAIFNNLTQKLNYLIKRQDYDRLRNLADYYEESGTRVGTIINNVLDWAITEKDSFVNQPQPIAVYTAVQDALAEFDFIIKKKNIALQIAVDENSQVFFDKNAFKIINRNLLSNALKFAPVGSMIRIFYRPEMKTLTFENAGEKIASQTIEHIQNGIPSSSTKGTLNESGTGIGLVTCSKLLQLNQGRLTIKNLSPNGVSVQVHFLNN